MSKVFPFFRSRVRPRGVFYRNFEISNKVGLSLPAYAEIFTGHQQSRVTDNTPRPGEERRRGAKEAQA